MADEDLAHQYPDVVHRSHPCYFSDYGEALSLSPLEPCNREAMATEENMDSAVCKGENRAIVAGCTAIVEGCTVVVAGYMEVQGVGCKADMVAL